MELPFFVIHGPLVWKLLIVVVALATLGLVRLAQRARARRHARRATLALDRKTDKGVVRGKLGGGGAATLIARRPTRLVDTLDHRADAMWIETADGKVELDGAIRVIAASRASAARNHLPAGTPAALAESTDVVTARLASVAPGDDVIAFGRLERTSGTGATDYRADAGALVLRAAEGEPIALAARTPHAATPPLAIFSVIALAAASGLFTWGLEKAFGAVERKSCEDASVRPGDSPREITNTHACAIAAAMPGSRDSALYHLHDLLERDPYRDRASLDRLLALSAILDGCDGELGELYHAERYDELLTVAKRCGDRRYQHIALVELGRFEDAVAITVPETVGNGSTQTLGALPTGPTLVLAGRWNEAAAAALRDADDVRKRDTDGKSAVTVRSYECLAELLHDYGGDTGAVDRLRALAAKPDGAACIPELLEVVPEAERPTWAAFHDTGSAGVDFLLDQLRWIGGYGDPVDGIDAAATAAVLGRPDDFDAYTLGTVIWLAKSLTSMPAGTDPALQTRLEQWHAVAAVIDGDLAEAHEYAVKAVIAVGADPNGRYVLRNLATLESMIDLYRADATPSYTIPSEDSNERELWLRRFSGLLLRRGDPLPKGTYFGPADEYKHALEIAERGDGGPLANQLGSRDPWWQDIDVMSVLPRVKTGRDAVVRQLVWSVPTDHFRLDSRFPFSVALHAAARRASLQVAGASAEAGRWNEIYQRYDQALRDHRKLIALAIWSH